jgi:hypothetical protein
MALAHSWLMILYNEYWPLLKLKPNHKKYRKRPYKLVRKQIEVTNSPNYRDVKSWAGTNYAPIR